MFGKKKNDKPRKTLLREGQFATVIGEGTIINGNVVTEAGLRVDGRINGDIEVSLVEGKSQEAIIAIGQNGWVQGNIRGERLLIAGTVNGNIEAADWVELNEGSKVNGDIRYKTLSIEPGASVAGKLLTQSD